MFIRSILIAAGTFFLLLGIIGIFIPGLPTTPFLLLTAGFYVRSSDRLYQRLISNRYVGSYITSWQVNRKLPGKTKVVSIALMWTMVLVSVFFFMDSTLLRIMVLSVAVVGTLVMGILIPTMKNRDRD